MPKTTERSQAGEYMTREEGGWITYRAPQPELQPDSTGLLAKAVASRPGNLRYAIESGLTYLIGELRDVDGLLSLADAHGQLFAPADQPKDEVSRLECVSVLAETGYVWSPVESDQAQWKAVAGDARGLRCELHAEVVEKGVEVRSSLPFPGDDKPTEPSQLALSRFIAAAHNRVRFVRFTLPPGEVHAVSFASANRLEIELPDSVAAVIAAVRLVSREVQALADATVAKAYLELHR
jgi:hypothetical protein